MAIVPRKLKSGGVVYWVANKWHGALVYERVGADRRAAERRDATMKREIKAGTYVPKHGGSPTVRSFADKWLSKRKNRSAENEDQFWRNHVEKRCAWFVEMKIRDVRPKHVLRLVGELSLPYEGAKTPDRKLAPKSVAAIFGTCKTMFRDARIEELVDVDPCVLPKNTLSRQPRKVRHPYDDTAALAMMSERVRWDRRVWNALAFYTGMREGEICGRRFRDWDPRSSPLGALVCSTQYNDQPLKTEKHGGERPRIIPVHPELDRILREWWESGFEFVFCRKPTMDDLIVPHEKIGVHTKSSGYKAWRKSCEEAGVGNMSLHSSRHTFITWARRCGARKEVLERITHNAKGDIVDRYTVWGWRPLCEAVACLRYDAPQFDARLDSMRLPRGFAAPAPGLEPQGIVASRSLTRRNKGHRQRDATRKIGSRPEGVRSGGPYL